MDMCRICLSTLANRDISELKLRKKEVQRSPTNIILFCLGIEIKEDSKITRKLCIKCFRKVICFYKFKTLALRNDDHLKALASDIKQEVIPGDSNDDDVFNSNECDALNDIDCPKEVKDEPEVKFEAPDDAPSDNESLSVIKQIKEEKPEDTEVKYKENSPLPKKRRGRPKGYKTRVKSKSNESVVCEECGKTVRNLKEHVKLHLPADKRAKFQCNSCDKVFTSYSARRKHFRTRHLGIKDHCDVCQKDVASLKAHQLVSHNPEQMRFQCVLCSRRFIAPSLLEAHMLHHTKDQPFECDICLKTYRTAMTLKHHKKQVHDKEKSHMCQFCSKSFYKKDHLNNHLRSHTNERPYKCDGCGKYFSSSTSLKKHQILHTGEKNFICDYCNVGFANREYLRKHLRSHTKEKPYPCKYCGQRYGRGDHRNRHQFTAHERPYLTNQFQT